MSRSVLWKDNTPSLGGSFGEIRDYDSDSSVSSVSSLSSLSSDSSLDSKFGSNFGRPEYRSNITNAPFGSLTEPWYFDDSQQGEAPRSKFGRRRSSSMGFSTLFNRTKTEEKNRRMSKPRIESTIKTKDSGFGKPKLTAAGYNAMRNSFPVIQPPAWKTYLPGGSGYVQKDPYYPSYKDIGRF